MALTKISRSLLDTGISDSSDATAITIDSSENVLIGTSSSSKNLRLQESFGIASTGALGGMAISGYSGTTAANRPLIDIQRSRGTSDESMTVVASGDYLGSIVFRGADGTNFIDGAEISARVDGTPGTGDMPTNLTFHTQADGAGGAAAERMRIDSNGVNIGATTIFSGSTELEVQYGITVKHSTTIGQARNIYMDDNAGALKYYNGYNVASLSNAGSWTNASDIAYKENIVDTEHGLDVVKLLQPRDYTLKSDSSSQTGFIAQELETHLPQFVEGDEGEKGVNYGQLTAVLTKAIQEQQEQIEALQSEINTLKGG
jgi:hypothetical protein